LAGVRGAARATFATVLAAGALAALRRVNVTSDGPITVTLAGCNRTIQAG
jgi:hypothetical protein